MVTVIAAQAQRTAIKTLKASRDSADGAIRWTVQKVAKARIWTALIASERMSGIRAAGGGGCTPAAGGSGNLLDGVGHPNPRRILYRTGNEQNGCH